MIIETVKLKNFRCFKEGYFELDPSCTVILGKNGSGKSSLLEALHYSCYLRSFRTHHNEELIFRDEKIEAGADHFFIEIAGEQKIKASFSLTGGKLVSYDSKKVQSYKELFSFHKVITVTAQDSELIQGAPEKRREFMNYALFLKKPDFFHYFQRYKNDLAQRNALLQRAYYEPYITKRDEFVLWSKQLWEGSLRIHKERCIYLRHVSENIEKLWSKMSDLDSSLIDQKPIFNYEARQRECYEYDSFEQFWRSWEAKQLAKEATLGRSLFGPHLDDFSVTFKNKKARLFASRGEQKFITFLLKAAQLLYVQDTTQDELLFLLDDVITDFDEKKLALAVHVSLSLGAQLVITAPRDNALLNLGKTIII